MQKYQIPHLRSTDILGSTSMKVIYNSFSKADLISSDQSSQQWMSHESVDNRTVALLNIIQYLDD